MKSILKQSHILVMAGLFLAFNACSTSNSNEEDLSLTPINTVVIDGYTVKLSALDKLETGDNYLFWELEKEGKSIDIETMTVMPMMDMGTMKHAAPFKTPKRYKERNRYFEGMIVFSMPSGDMGSWTINFTITTKDGQTIEGSIEVNIASSWRFTSVKDKDGKGYFITWAKPSVPKMGNNNLAILVHTKESMMSFPAVSDAEVIIYPFMDMGSGEGHSTNFTAPVSKGNGLYEGSINYSMSGTWTTSVQLVVANDTLPEVIFEYSVKAK
ncbi:MAG: FixH family protein [Balneolaceae bacterium]